MLLHVHPDLPLPLDVALPILGVAVLVLLVVTYEFYSTYGGSP